MAAPVAITANTTYVVSYHTNTGFYSADSGYFAAAGSTTARCTRRGDTRIRRRTASSVTAPSAFPDQTFNERELLGRRGLRHSRSARHDAADGQRASPRPTAPPDVATCGRDRRRSARSMTAATVTQRPSSFATRQRAGRRDRQLCERHADRDAQPAAPLAYSTHLHRHASRAERPASRTWRAMRWRRTTCGRSRRRGCRPRRRRRARRADPRRLEQQRIRSRGTTRKFCAPRGSTPSASRHHARSPRQMLCRLRRRHPRRDAR